MKAKPRKIQVRIEELPTAGDMIVNAFKRDQPDFVVYSPDFGEAYATDATQQLEAVTELVSPRLLMGELKDITANIYKNQALLQEPLNLLEGYINRAKPLTMAPKDFGIKLVRNRSNRGDIEGLTTRLKELLDAVSLNMTALSAKGYTAHLHDTLLQLYTSFKADNSDQKLKQQSITEKVNANIEIVNKFWLVLADICDTGKRIYKKKAPHKLPDYTISAIKKALRNERKKAVVKEDKKEG